MTTSPVKSSPALNVRVPAYEAFPVDALPHPLAQYVSEGAPALGCDPAMVALPCLSVCGSLIGNTRTIRLKNSWREPCVFWTCVVADSGTLKSPALDLAVRPLNSLQTRLKTEHAARFMEHQALLEEWKKRKERDAANAAPKPEPPIMPRIACNDVTVERLGELLEENPRGLLLARDELAGWFGSFTRYKTGSSDLPNWLEFHRAGSATIDRKTTEKKTLFINRAAVSVAGTIQPGILAKLVKGDFLDAGLIARLLLAMPPKARKVWRDVDLDSRTADAYEQLLENLYRLDFGANGKGERVAVALSLDADAQRGWRAFFNAWAGEQFNSEGELAAALSKLEGYAARLTLLHHVVKRIGAGQDDREPIGVESVEAGVKLCRWFAHEADRVYALFGETAEQRETRRLVEFIQTRGGTVTARDLCRANARRYPTVASADCALDALAGAGLGQWSTSTQAAGGRPSKVFRLHGPADAGGPPCTTEINPSVRVEQGQEPPVPMPPIPTKPPPIALSLAEPVAFSTVDADGDFDPLASPYR